MSNYNWPKIGHDLAVELFGGRTDQDECGCKYVQVKNVSRMLLSVQCEDHGDRVREWHPERDLNQAVECAKETEWVWTLSWMPGMGEHKAIAFDNFGNKINEYSTDPARAICLAVLRAIGEDLSDCEEVDNV